MAQVFNEVFNVTDTGNWEENNILHRTESWIDLSHRLKMTEAELEEVLAVAKRKLFHLRGQRIRPGIDSKALTSWNAMMIHSLALAHQVLNEPSYLEPAQKAVNFILNQLWMANT